MTSQHKQSAGGDWNKLSLAAQLANVGSEVGRALKWREKNNEDYSRLAFERALELLDLTVEDEKNKMRLKEILRIREVLIDYFNGKNFFNETPEALNKYFYSFNVLARAAS